jgi:hypothetical protein
MAMLVTLGALGSPLSAAHAGPEDPQLRAAKVRTRGRRQFSHNAHALALTALHEATNQPETGQRMVMHVVKERADYWNIAYYERVLFSRGQFTVWSDELKLDFLRCQLHDSYRCFESLALRRLGSFPCEGECAAKDRYYLLVVAADAILNGTPPPLGWERAYFFDNPRGWPEGYTPSFARDDTLIGCIADHCFWRRE